MIFASIIAHIKDRLAKRARFRRMIDEINSLTSADLTDLPSRLLARRHPETGANNA